MSYQTKEIGLVAGKMSRNKGQRAEREVIGLLQPVVNEVWSNLGLSLDVRPKLERNLMQSASGGYDIAGLEWIALEVKHQEQFQINQWWKQCVKQSRQYQMPVLFYRKNHSPWKVRTYAVLWLPYGETMAAPADFSVDDFLAYFRIRIEQEFRLRQSDL